MSVFDSFFDETEKIAKATGILPSIRRLLIGEAPKRSLPTSLSPKELVMNELKHRRSAKAYKSKAKDVEKALAVGGTGAAALTAGSLVMPKRTTTTIYNR